jgi:hypothetical protein
MESIFGISYPTVKNRLNALSAKLNLVDVEVNITASASAVLERLEKGEITAEQALKELKS